MVRQHIWFFYSRKRCIEKHVWDRCYSRGLVPWGQWFRCDHDCWHPWSIQQKQRKGTIQLASKNTTRNTIERSFHVLKSKIRCLDTSGGTLFYSPLKACKINIAVAILQNMWHSWSPFTCWPCPLQRKNRTSKPHWSCGWRPDYTVQINPFYFCSVSTALCFR